MVFLLVTALVSGVIIFLGALALDWLVKKVAPKYAASLGLITRTTTVVAVMTGIYMFVMTRPGVVGPYEQWTFANIGGQILGGAVAAGLILWIEKKTGS